MRKEGEKRGERKGINEGGSSRIHTKCMQIVLKGEEDHKIRKL